jgi:hypothetical protein
LGNKVITLSPEEDKRWAEAVKPVVDEYINTVSQKGLPGNQWVDTVRKLMAQFK